MAGSKTKLAPLKPVLFAVRKSFSDPGVKALDWVAWSRAIARQVNAHPPAPIDTSDLNNLCFAHCASVWKNAGTFNPRWELSQVNVRSSPQVAGKGSLG